MNKIKTSKIQYQINKEKISQKYEIYNIITKDKYFKQLNNIFDFSIIDNRILSIYYNSSNSVYVLLEKNDMNRMIIDKCIKKMPEYNNLILESMNVGNIDDYKLLQLLLNALPTLKTYNKFNNFTGSLYVFNVKNIVRDKKSKKIRSIIALECRINQHYNLSIKVKTFSNIFYKKYMMFTSKKNFDSYSLFEYTDTYNIKRAINKVENKEYFILKGLIDKKNSIDFINFTNDEYFKASKVGIIDDVINNFNNKYIGIANIYFSDFDETISIETSKTKLLQKKNIKEILLDNEIYIVDNVKNEYTKNDIDLFRSVLKEDYHIEAILSDSVVKDNLNFVYIHNNDWYKVNRLDDIHINRNDISVQHFTYEDFPITQNCQNGAIQKNNNLKFAINNIIEEILIKRDIINGNISLFNWESLQLDENLKFVCLVNNDDKEMIISMEIENDGKCNFRIINDINIISEEDIDIIHIFNESKYNKDGLVGVICDSKHNINIIYDTDYYTIPDIDDIKKYLELGDNNAIKRVDNSNKIFYSLLGIRTFFENNKIYYYVGISRTSDISFYNIHNSCNIRQIDKYNDSEFIIEKIMPTMNVMFVRNEQLTIIPFPYKYIREWATMNL